MSKPGKTLGCIGKCTSGLSSEEIDYITDKINNTLGHVQGRKIFRRFLEEGHRKTDIACLDFYEQCLNYIENDRSYRLSVHDAGVEALASDLNLALSTAEELDGVEEIDMALLERYTEALDSNSRDAMINVLEDTKTKLMHHLRNAHRGFRAYAVKPCPKK